MGAASQKMGGAISDVWIDGMSGKEAFDVDKIWEHYDVDGNKSIDQAECRKLVSEMGDAVLSGFGKFVDNAWNNLPKHKRQMMESSGAGKEMMLGLRPLFENAVNAQMKSEEGHLQMFADMDIDSDGQVSKKELRKWLHEQEIAMQNDLEHVQAQYGRELDRASRR